jgi:hypothetical protein
VKDGNIMELNRARTVNVLVEKGYSTYSERGRGKIDEYETRY